MGLSSSQARLLTLTGRMHDIEYKAQKLEAQKLQLANETRQVYENYLNALDMTKIQNKILREDGSVSYVDSTYKSLIGKKLDDNTIYILRDAESGKFYVDEVYKCAYDSSNKTLDGFLKTLNSIESEVSDSYVSVSTAEDLMAMSNSSGNFRLDKDITLSDWSGIENFKGKFDGNGHTITIEGGNNGLFASTTGATIRNVNIAANINADAKYVGGLIGKAYNTVIENVGVTGNITAQRFVGGLVGYIKGNSTISNCETSANVYANYVSPNNGYGTGEENDYLSYAGGLIGYATGGNGTTLNINDTTTNGSVNAEYWFSGGFIGLIKTNVNFTNCVAGSNVVGNCSGHGDDYKPLLYPDGTRYIPYVAAFSAYTDDGGFAVTLDNCNSVGSVSANGDAANTRLCDFSWYVTTPQFNNFYSSVDPAPYTVSVPNVYSPAISSSSYPNLMADDLTEAIEMFNILDSAGGGLCVPEGCEDSTEWFSNVVMGGYAIISKYDVSKSKEFSVYDVNVAVDTNLQKTQNNVELRKAEAKYEADMKRIDLKDRKYDTDLAALETERNAIKQEIDTLKTVAKENVERTFKLFG